ncbi:MAG: hypothetical protein U5K69_17805 [Balneolaceae bacterium]|nr:hypothetical protein [Balneolaceae bacterium]
MSYSANYSGGYQWRNGPQGSNLGSTLTNNLSVSQNLELDIRNLLSRMGWYERLMREQPVNPNQEEANDPNENIVNILKETAQAVLSLQSLDISFSNSKRSQQAGYDGGSQIYYMFNTGGDNFSPPFSYRTGWTDRIGPGQLVDNPNQNQSIQIPSNKNYTDDLTVGTRLTPFENFSIDLTWSSKWDVTSTKTLTLRADESSSSVRDEKWESKLQCYLGVWRGIWHVIPRAAESCLC